LAFIIINFHFCAIWRAKKQKGPNNMTQKTEEICGSFAVVTEQREIKKVVVIQDALSYYGKEKKYSKTFRIDSLNGTPVYGTEDPNIFRQEDGSLLKRTHQ
jgi:hypothetical protein